MTNTFKSGIYRTVKSKLISYLYRLANKENGKQNALRDLLIFNFQLSTFNFTEGDYYAYTR
jgi:hypothetical protein